MLLPVILGEKANNTFTFVPGKITPTVPPSFTTTPRSYQRDEFQKLVVGKTKLQLIDLLGKPTSTSEAGPWEYWQYNERTIDPVTGKVDTVAQLSILDGKVTMVLFV